MKLSLKVSIITAGVALLLVAGCVSHPPGRDRANYGQPAPAAVSCPACPFLLTWQANQPGGCDTHCAGTVAQATCTNEDCDLTNRSSGTTGAEWTCVEKHDLTRVPAGASPPAGGCHWPNLRKWMVLLTFLGGLWFVGLVAMCFLLLWYRIPLPAGHLSKVHLKSKAQAREDLSSFTGIISTQIRTIALTLLAISFVGMAKPSEYLKDSAFLERSDILFLLFLVGVFAFLALLVDYAHYLIGTLKTRQLLEAVPDKLDTDVVVPDYIRAPEYGWMRGLFWIKQYVLYLAVTTFFTLAGLYVLHVIRNHLVLLLN